MLCENNSVGCTSGDLRLNDDSSGILHLCKDSEWKIVCSDNWGNLDAAVACRQLGYNGIFGCIVLKLVT